jgi:malonyl CoA-acyl carrier protein transacylase
MSLFFFPGQGSQFAQMGMHLYKMKSFTKCCRSMCCTLLNEIPTDIREILYPEVVTAETEAN